MCKAREQLAFALDTYDRAQKAAGNQDGCKFSGSATSQSAVQPTGACSSKISAAGDGTKSTAKSGPSGSSGSSSSRGAAAGGMTQASLNFGSLQIGIYAICAIVSGVGMILL
jgi:1,3-beta-glucanosyltransferase GAS1